MRPLKFSVRARFSMYDICLAWFYPVSQGNINVSEWLVVESLVERDASTATSPLHPTNQRYGYHASHQSAHTAGISCRLSLTRLSGWSAEAMAGYIDHLSPVFRIGLKAQALLKVSSLIEKLGSDVTATTQSSSLYVEKLTCLLLARSLALWLLFCCSGG